MKVLGISCYYHDASAALVENGQVLAAAAEERFSLQKHDPNFPKLAIEFCLNQAGISKDQIDAIVFYEEPAEKFTRVIASSISGFPFSSSMFTRSIKSWLGSKLWIKNEIAKRLDFPIEKIHSISHHLSHASHAFLGSPFNKSAVLIVDAVGEWSCTSIFYGDRDLDNKLELIESYAYPHSLGLLFSAFTGFLGFRVNDQECNIMALASFGKPKYVDEIKKVIQLNEDGSYQIDPSYFDFEGGKSDYLRPKFIELFGPRRNFKQRMNFDCLSDVAENVADEDQRYADIAASVQQVLEEAILGLAERAKKLTGSNNLCYAGGVALNCRANSHLVNQVIFDSIYIPCDPGDGGASQGAALYFEAKNSTKAGFQPSSPYLGKDYASSSEIKLIDHLKPSHFNRHLKQGLSLTAELGWETIDFEKEEELLESVTRDLVQKKIVGWFQGRFENGPRALGNRSLLFLPSDILTARRCSKEVKSRAPFRPYALSITDLDAYKIFEEKVISNSSLNSWMQKTASVLPSQKNSVRAALHIDGTTRPQICLLTHNPRFFKLLQSVGEATGLSALVNTSLNDSGFPLISSPSEALILFLRTGLDTLVLENRVIRKRT
jgi:carbamoyltransferase